MPDGKLTEPERLLIGRRRSGQTQAQAAKDWGVSQSRYSRWERGLDPIQAHIKDVPTKLSELEPHERCLIYRRRVARTQAEVATDINRCKMWVRQMERGEVDCTELVNYWEQ